MTVHILVVHDGSAPADVAVEAALDLAGEFPERSLFVLKILQSSADPLSRRNAEDDLMSFAKLGQRLGIEVDGELTEDLSLENLARVLRQRRISHLVIGHASYPDAATPLVELLLKAAAICGVEVSNAYERRD